MANTRWRQKLIAEFEEDTTIPFHVKKEAEKTIHFLAPYLNTSKTVRVPSSFPTDDRKQIIELVVYGSRALASIDYIVNVKKSKKAFNNFKSYIKHIYKMKDRYLDLMLLHEISHIREQIDAHATLDEQDIKILNVIFNLKTR